MSQKGVSENPTLCEPAVESSRAYFSVNFACQKCGNPLNLDDSFYDNTSLEELQNSCVDSYNEDSQSDSNPDTPPSQQPLENDENFTIVNEVPDTDDNLPANIGHKLKVQTKLFDILSDTSSFDHPMCEDCADNLLNSLDYQLQLSETEYNDYSKFYEQFKNEQSENEVELDIQLNQLTEQYDALRLELASVDEEHAAVQDKMAAAKSESRRLRDNEKRYYENYNEYKLQLINYNDSHMSIDNQIQYSEKELEKLKKTNVFNSTFHIWHNGHFGTINGFRLGRLPSIPVEWSEINTAWGQTALLLNSLATRMGLTFKKYKIRPLGNNSHIELLDEPNKILPLYSTGGFKLLWDTKFDRAMVAFLDCLQQFKDEVEKGDTSFILPYKMDNGRIEDSTTGQSFSIRIQFNCEEQWTKSLKYMLTNLKWILAWVSSQYHN